MRTYYIQICGCGEQFDEGDPLDITGFDYPRNDEGEPYCPECQETFHTIEVVPVEESR